MTKATVITYGTFDMFHVGHLNLIRKLRVLGDRLIIGVSTDEFNALKGKRCIIPYEQRKNIVENIKGVDLVIPECDWGQKIKDIEEFNVDIFVMGSDWEGKFDYLSSYCSVKYFPRTEGVSTSDLKNILNEPVKKIKTEIDQVFRIIETIKRNLD